MYPNIYYSASEFLLSNDQNNKRLNRRIPTGDSGSPAFWKHTNKKEYLIGIVYEVHAENDCELGPKNTVKASKYVAVPGVIFKWIIKNGGKEVEEWMKKC